jgi:hypothetical protein
MTQKVNGDGVRHTWHAQGADAADALFDSRESPDDAPTRWWILGCELAAARADLKGFEARWLRGWSQAAQQPALRQAMAEALLEAPWDGELAALWQLVADDAPGKPNWRRQLVKRAVSTQHPAGARTLMSRVDKAESGGNWWPQVMALWAGEGDEPWVAAWLRQLDKRWLLADAGHSNFIPDIAAFGRLDHWVNGGHAAVIEAWRALVPPGAWADWLDMAAVVARWRAGNGLWSPCVSWPASVKEAWPKPVQRQALARLALLAKQPALVRPPWLRVLEDTLARHWPPEAAQRATAHIELNWMHATDADSERIMEWLESKAGIEDLRSWWAPRALRECHRQTGGLSFWEDWCEQFGVPELGLGGAGHGALSALCQVGRAPQAQALLEQWRQDLTDPASADDLAWLAVSEITLAVHQQQHAEAWQALNHWWQRQGLTPLKPGAEFSTADMLDAMAGEAWAVPAATATVEPVTAMLLWPAEQEADKDAHEAARLTLRSLQMQDASGLTVLVVTDRESPDVATPPGAQGTPVRVLRVSPEQDVAQRTDLAIAAVDTPWLIWVSPGSVWHPQALRARQQHLARHPQAEASQALQLSLDRFGEISAKQMRSGVAAAHDGYMVRTQRLRALSPLMPGVPDGWPLMRERVERQLGALRRPVWPCSMGLQLADAAYAPKGLDLATRHQRALDSLAQQLKPVEEFALG